MTLLFFLCVLLHHYSFPVTELFAGIGVCATSLLGVAGYMIRTRMQATFVHQSRFLQDGVVLDSSIKILWLLVSVTGIISLYAVFREIISLRKDRSEQAPTEASENGLQVDLVSDPIYSSQLSCARS